MSFLERLFRIPRFYSPAQRSAAIDQYKDGYQDVVTYMGYSDVTLEAIRRDGASAVAMPIVEQFFAEASKSGKIYRQISLTVTDRQVIFDDHHSGKRLCKVSLSRVAHVGTNASFNTAFWMIEGNGSRITCHVMKLKSAVVVSVLIAIVAKAFRNAFKDSGGKSTTCHGVTQPEKEPRTQSDKSTSTEVSSTSSDSSEAEGSVSDLLSFIDHGVTGKNRGSTSTCTGQDQQDKNETNFQRSRAANGVQEAHLLFDMQESKAASEVFKMPFNDFLQFVSSMETEES